MDSINPGDKFNRLTVVEYSYTNKQRRKCFICKCDCGNTATIQSNNLKSGHTKSCGCFARETNSKVNKSRFKGERSLINRVYGNYKKSAKSRNIPFDLTNDEVEKLIFQNCYYCTAKPENKCRVKLKNDLQHEDLLYNGIDRVDNSKGYTVNNVVPCCTQCNFAKRSLSIKDFKQWIMKVYENLSN